MSLRLTAAVAAVSLSLAALGACGGGGARTKQTGPGDSRLTSTEVGPPAPALEAAPPGCTIDDRMDTYSRVPHVDDPRYRGPLANPPRYPVDPPSGGDHLSVPAPAASYPPSQVPADGNVVHSLEHGKVVLWYRPDAVAPADVSVLDGLARSNPGDVLVVPRTGLSTTVAATAWHVRLLCHQVQADSLAAFVKRHRYHAPETVPG